MDDIVVQDAIGYSFKGLQCCPIIEEIVKELKLESNRYWMRPVTKDDWYANGDYIVMQSEPILLEEYELTYDIPYTIYTKNKVMFAGYLIDSYLEYIGYLEGCLLKEIDNKKEDTE